MAGASTLKYEVVEGWELRRRYGASVGTLREALSHLVSEGLARTATGRGWRSTARTAST